MDNEFDINDGDQLPPLPAGVTIKKSDNGLPPLPKGVIVKKKDSVGNQPPSTSPSGNGRSGSILPQIDFGRPKSDSYQKPLIPGNAPTSNEFGQLPSLQQKHDQEVAVAKEKVRTTLSDIHQTAIKHLEKQQRNDFATWQDQRRRTLEQQGIDIGEFDPKVNPLQAPEKQKVDELVSDPTMQPTLLSEKANELQKEGKKKEASDLKANTYLLQRAQSDGNREKQLKIANQIKNDELDYDIKNGEVYKTVSGIEGAVEAAKQNIRNTVQGAELFKANDEEKAKILNNLYSQKDHDEPSTRIEGAMANFAGSQLPIMAAGAVPGVGEGLIAGQLAAQGYQSGMEQTYPIVKAKLLKEKYPDLSDSEIAQKIGEPDPEIDKQAVHQATIVANEHGLIDAATGYFMNKLGGKGVPKSEIKPFSIAAQESIHGLAGAVKTAALFGTAQAAKNISSEQQGVKTQEGSVAEAALQGAYLHAGFWALAKAGGTLKAAEKKLITHNLAEQPIEEVQKTADNLVQNGLVEKDKADEIVSEVIKHQEFNNQIPDKVKKESVRIEIAKDLQRLEDLKAEHDKVGEPFKPAVKERIEKLKEEINEKASSPEAKQETSREPIIKPEENTNIVEPIKPKEIIPEEKSRVINYDSPEKLDGFPPDSIMHFGQGMDNNRITLVTDPNVKSEYTARSRDWKRISGSSSGMKHILKDIAKNFRDKQGNDKIIDLRGIDLSKPLPDILKELETKKPNQNALQEPSVKNAIQEKNVLPLEENNGKQNTNKNELSEGLQANSGINKKTGADVTTEISKRANKASIDWVKAISGNDKETQRNAEKELFGESMAKKNERESGLLVNSDRKGSEVRTSSGNGEKIGETTSSDRARTSQGWKRVEQLAGELGIVNPISPYEASSERENRRAETNFRSIPETKRRAMVSNIQQLFELPNSYEKTRIERSLHDMLREGGEKEKEFITKNIEYYALRKQFSEGLFQHPQEGVGSEGGERGRVEPSQQGEIPTGTRPEIQNGNAAANVEEKSTGQEPVNKIQSENVPRGTSDVSQTEEGGGKIGVHHAALTDLATELGLPSPESAEHITPEEHALRGRKMMDAGAPVEEVNNKSNELHDRISLGRAYLEKYYNELNGLRKSKGIDSSEYLSKKGEIESLSKTLKELGSKAGQGMTSLQGQRDIDTDNFEVAKKRFEEQNERPLTPSESKKLEQLTSDNETLRKRAENAEAQLKIATDKALSEEPAENKKSTTEKAKAIADRLRKAKVHRPDSFSAATPASLVWDGAIETVAKTIEAGGIVADAIQAGLEHIKASDWYKSISDEQKKKAEEDFTNWNKDQSEPAQPTIESLWKKFVDKHDNDFTKDESKAIWDYAKKTYLDKGVKYADMISKVVDDTGLSWRQVQAAITPKNQAKYLNDASDKMWKERSAYRKNQNATKRWMDEQTQNPFVRAAKKVTGTFRGSAVFGHGAIFVGTHSGMTLFDPLKVKHTVRAFLNGYKFAYGNKGAYERSMQELRDDPNYLLAQRAGLKNNPDNMNAEDYQASQKYLGKLAGAGERGFNAIKVLRQNLFNYEHNKLSEAEKNDPGSAKAIAHLINNATGATNLTIPESINEVTFAGGMEAARWGKLTTNPLKATTTALHALFKPKSVSIEDKVFAKVWAKRVGAQLGTMATMLAVNSAIQSMIDDKNKVNVFNPNKPDWLKFKFGNMTIDPTSGMRGAANFIYGLAKIPLQTKKERHGDTALQSAGKNVVGYARGKLSPFYSTVADFYSASDFKGNPLPKLPWADEKPTANHHKLTWGEYLWQKAPLPIAEAATDTYNAALNQGGDKKIVDYLIHGIISGALSGATGFRFGEYNAQEKNHSPYTEQDNNRKAFKYFLDKGLELPNTAPSSEKITNEHSKERKTLSEYPIEVQEKYAQVHKDELETELNKYIKKDNVFIKKYSNGDISVSFHNNGGTRTKVEDLSKEELEKILHTAQSEATKRTKLKMFPAKR